MLTSIKLGIALINWCLYMVFAAREIFDAPIAIFPCWNLFGLFLLRWKVFGCIQAF